MTNPLALRRLYLCTPLRDDLPTFVAEAIAGGVDIVQLREKHADAATILSAARVLNAICEDVDVPFILNDRPDLALELGCSGVHVGQDDAPVSLCRQILGPDAIVGLSTHAPHELEVGMTTSATYLSAGPIEATPTKPGRAGTGRGYAVSATRLAEVPVFVTGGVSAETIPSRVAAGLEHFVVVRALTEATDPRRAAAELRDAIDRTIDA